MFVKRIFRLHSLAIILSTGFMIGCGPSAEQQAATSVALTAAAATNTPTVTTTRTPISTPTLKPPPAITESATATPMLSPFGEPILAPELNDASVIPVTGVFVPELRRFDEAIVQFMAENNIGAGTLTISKGDQIVLEHGYGWFDQQRTIPISPGTTMRIASLVKPITMAVVNQLIQEGEFTTNTKVFCVNDTRQDCLLKIEPPPGQDVDPQLGNVTVSHLLLHRGGWDEDVSFDPMFASIEIAEALGIASPPVKADIASYMMGQPLDFAPGSREKYSNYGYLLLGLIIEEVTRQPYVTYVQENFLAPMGIYDVELARSLREDRSNPREISYYHCPGVGENVFKPGTVVCWPDGGYYIEAMDAHGGLTASSRSIVTFLDNYCMGDGRPRRASCGEWIFFGSLDGTHTMAHQIDDVSLAVVFNKRGPNSERIYDIMSEAVDATYVWP